MPTQDSVRRNSRPSGRAYASSSPVSEPMCLTTVADFLGPAPLQKHKYYPQKPGKTALQKAVFSVTMVGTPRPEAALGFVPANRPTHAVTSQGSFFLRKRPEINLQTRRSSPHKSGAHALCQRELARLTSEPLGSAQVIPTCVVETEVTASGTRGPGTIQALFLCPEAFHMKQTMMSACLSYLGLCEG